MRYTVLRDNFQHDGKHVPFGEPVELTEAQAESLLALKAIEPRDEASFEPAESSDGVSQVEISGDGTGEALAPIDDSNTLPPSGDESSTTDSAGAGGAVADPAVAKESAPATGAPAQGATRRGRKASQ
jgi:hypothetical protein